MAKTIKDYYAVLRVPQNATQDEIRLAYRQMARTYHPDINNAPDAEERFREINEAYEILADPDRRKSYDFFTVPENSDVADLQDASPDPVASNPKESTVSSTPPQKSPARRARGQRIFPPTWAILLIVLGVCIIGSVGVGALMSLRRNRPTGGAESANVNKLTTFISPPKIPENITVVQEAGTPILTAQPNRLDIAGTIFPVVPVTPEQGRWPLPQEQDAIAVWIYGTVINYVVGLPYTLESESLLASLTSADRIALTLDNGNVLAFGSPVSQRIALDDLSPMAQGKPGITLVLLGSDQTTRLTVQARYLPEESLFAEDQRVEDLRVEVLQSSIPSKTGDMLQFVIEYQITNEKAVTVDPTFFDMILQDSSGQSYMRNEGATNLGEYGPLNTPIAPGEIAAGSVGYLVPSDVPGPLTWVFRSDVTSANSASFVLPYQPPKPGPAIPDVVLSEVFDDVTRNVVVINGSVYNDGESPLTVTLDRIKLTSGQGESNLQAATPLLPWTIEPGGSQGFEMQFARPSNDDAVLLEMLGFTYRIEGLQQ